MLILQNVTALQFEPALVQGGVDIAIEGSLIQEVGTALAARYPQAQVREMQGRLVMPGIVCSHNHFYSGLARGIMAQIKPCPDFISTLKNLWWRLDRALDEESLYYSGLICSLEAIKSGCTAVIDHHASPNYVAGSLSTLRRGFVEAGLRGITCYETTHRNGGDAELESRRRRERGLRPADRRGQGQGRRALSGGGHDRRTRALHDLAQGHGAAAAKPCSRRGAACTSTWPRTATTFPTATMSTART